MVESCWIMLNHVESCWIHKFGGCISYLSYLIVQSCSISSIPETNQISASSGSTKANSCEMSQSVRGETVSSTPLSDLSEPCNIRWGFYLRFLRWDLGISMDFKWISPNMEIFHQNSGLNNDRRIWDMGQMGISPVHTGFNYQQLIDHIIHDSMGFGTHKNGNVCQPWWRCNVIQWDTFQPTIKGGLRISSKFHHPTWGSNHILL